jgi:hypothetical protein
MRLLGRLNRAAAKTAKRGSGIRATGIVWTSDEKRLPDLPAAGEHLAVDVWIDELTADSVKRARIEERHTCHEGDYGYVWHAGQIVGRVQLSDGSLLVWVPTAITERAT